MKYMIVQAGKEGRLVVCSCCYKEFRWLRCFEAERGLYEATCRACRVSMKKGVV